LNNEEPITPMRRVGTVLLTFVAGCAAAVGLYMWWSDRCGEACPSPNVVHMLAFLGLLPTLATMTAVLLVSTAWPRRVKVGLVAVLLLAAVIVGVVLGSGVGS
jgi:ferric-dicitrate binding protein FerR (iron transport regulator)